MTIRLFFAAAFSAIATAGFASEWEFDTYADVSKLKFGTLLLNVGARNSDENHDFNNKHFKRLPYGETTTVTYQESYCLNIVHYAPFLDAKSRAYKISQVTTLPSGLSLAYLHTGTFTPTGSPNSGRYPDYCFTWPEEAEELHFTVVALPFRSKEEVVLRRAPM